MDATVKQNLFDKIKVRNINLFDNMILGVSLLCNWAYNILL